MKLRSYLLLSVFTFSVADCAVGSQVDSPTEPYIQDPLNASVSSGLVAF